MKPFRASLPGQIISSSIAFALIVGGLIPILGLNATVWIPLSLLIPIGACIVGAVLGVGEYAGAVAALVIALPLVLWPYSMALIWVTTSRPQYAWALLAAGAVVATLTVASGVARAVTSPAAASVKHSVV